MQLKHDCVRNLLLTIEGLGYNEALTLEKCAKMPLLANYEDVDIVYTAERLQEAGFIDATIRRLSGNNVLFRINSLTWAGHQFLDNIRDETVWRETKQVASKVASASLNVLSDIAAGLIRKTLGLD